MDFETNSSGKVAALLQFEWGTGHVTRYTSWDEELTLADSTVWTSEPRLEVRPAEVDGSYTDKPWTVRVPTTVDPINKLIRPFKHARVTCRLWTVDLSDLATRKEKWAGHVTRTTASPDGLVGVVDVEVSGWKSLIAYPVGLELKEGCANVFGLSPCDYDLAARRQTGTVTGITGYAVTFSGDVTVPTGYSTYWEAGSMAYDGLRIQILGRSDHTFRLKHLPPPEWLGASVTIEPGCLKKIKNCRERGQEHHFNGIGIASPIYDPLIDDPTGVTG